MKDSFDLDIEEIEKYKKSRVIASSCKDVIEEKLSEGQHQDTAGTGRLIIHTV